MDVVRSREKSIVPHSQNFHCTSFKDILHLCSDDSSSDRRLHSTSIKPPSIYHRIRRINLVLCAISTSTVQPPISIPGTEKRVVIYFTNLRVVRSTFNDCRTVQSILNGFRIPIDERDLAMDSSFHAELQRILGHYQKMKLKLTLPKVFISGRYIGGADEVRNLHESGELKKLLQGLPATAGGVCNVCGGHHFILCDECRGSHKCYSDKSGFRICTACNENGLIRCPTCYCSSI